VATCHAACTPRYDGRDATAPGTHGTTATAATDDTIGTTAWRWPGCTAPVTDRAMPARGLVLAGMVVSGMMFVELHGPNGARLFVNPHEVTSVRDATKAMIAQHHVAAGSHCALLMSNGNLITVQERCDEVRQKLEGKGE
jgi:hypothetical protein